MPIPVLPSQAPFDPIQREWINGYLAGLFSGRDVPAPASSAERAKPDRGPLLFLWGSQTGSAEKLAKKFARHAASVGFSARAAGLHEMEPTALADAKRVAIVTSTYGDGDMPDNAQAFWNRLRNGDAPRLENLEFSVLALGDTNYVQFCQAGKLFDERLEQLGARRIHPRTDCDVDYDQPASQWLSGLLKALGADSSSEESASSLSAAEDKADSGGNAYCKENPFPAVLVGNRVLNGPGSAKEVRHIEIALAGSGLEYEVGDALGVVPSNCPEFVSEILAAAGLRGSEPVSTHAGLPLRSVLLNQLDLSPFLTASPQPGISPEELVQPLRRLQPRLYSISSSPKAHPGEVHLTVGVVRYEINGRPRKGVCSTFLADRSTGSIPVFVHSSPGFRLPADPATPIIMVGPGTGVAPFRAFLEERRAIGASGKNWLFFGDQKSACDFLYRNELLAWQHDGHLHRLDTAFSRDQSEKIYVQHRMQESAAQLWAWLQDGAYFYVCGDAKRMARDVDAALHDIVAEHGGLSPEAAAAYVEALKAQKRYQRDVY